MEASAAHTGRAPKKTFMQKAFEAYQASYEALLPKLNANIEKVHSMGAEVLLSCHPGIPMTSEQVVELALFLEKRNPDIIKIVTRADQEDDLAESIRTMLMLNMKKLL